MQKVCGSADILPVGQAGVTDPQTAQGSLPPSRHRRIVPRISGGRNLTHFQIGVLEILPILLPLATSTLFN